MMATDSPYRLQVFLPFPLRDALRDIAHEERTSLQKLIAAWLLERATTYPKWADLRERLEGDDG